MTSPSSHDNDNDEIPMLRDYQREDLAFHIANPRSLNLGDPGTGKTPTACVLMYYWWAKKGWKTVWSMPKSLMEKNREELIRFTEFTEDDVVILESDHAPLTQKWTGPTKMREKRVKKLLHDNDNQPLLGPDGEQQFRWETEQEETKDLIAAAADAKVFICTFAFLRNNHEKLLATHPDIGGFCIDELHMGYSTPGSEQTDSFYRVADHCEGLLGMTGTLVDGRLDSAFPVLHAIEPRYYGGLNGFLHEHAAWINDYGKVQSWKNIEKLAEVIRRVSVRRDFESVYGKEPVHFETVTVPMGDKQRDKYDEFHEQAMLELDDGEILDGSQPGVALIRASQIMAHPETMGLAKNEITPKDRKLMEYAAEGRPMLVFSAHQAEQERCKKRLESCGMRVGLINAEVSAAERGRIDRAFRNEELDAIVGSGPTVAVGYNWERADHVVNVSLDYKDVNFIQAYRRASRGNRKTTLRVTTLAYEDSIDQKKFQILTAKSELARQVDPTRKKLSFR